MTYHPVADIFPMMTDAELLQLADDIKAHGLILPILLHPDGRVLDGRNRLRACELADVPPRFDTWDGIGSEVARVVSLNEKRRHMSPGQLALVAARIANLPNGFHPPISDEIGRPQRIADAAQLLGISEAHVHRGKVVLSHGTPELVDAVQAGTVTVSAAAELTRLSDDDQRSVIADGRAAQTAEQLRQSSSRRPRIVSAAPTPAVEPSHDRSTAAAKRRLDRIRQLARDGHNSQQIAAQLHMHVGSVRDIIRRNKIACPGDLATNHSRKHDPNRIVDQIATAAENLMLGADLIDFKCLAADRLPEWIHRLDTARTALAGLIGRLRKERQRHGEHETAQARTA